MRSVLSFLFAILLLSSSQLAVAAGVPGADSYGDPSANRGTLPNASATNTVPNKTREACVKEGRNGADLDTCMKSPQEPATQGSKGSQKASGSDNLVR